MVCAFPSSRRMVGARLAMWCVLSWGLAPKKNSFLEPRLGAARWGYSCGCHRHMHGVSRFLSLRPRHQLFLESGGSLPVDENKFVVNKPVPGLKNAQLLGRRECVPVQGNRHGSFIINTGTGTSFSHSPVTGWLWPRTFADEAQYGFRSFDPRAAANAHSRAT